MYDHIITPVPVYGRGDAVLVANLESCASKYVSLRSTVVFQKVLTVNDPILPVKVSPDMMICVNYLPNDLIKVASRRSGVGDGQPDDLLGVDNEYGADLMKVAYEIHPRWLF